MARKGGEVGRAGREKDFLLLPEGETKQEKAESRGCVKKGIREQNEEEGVSLYWHQYPQPARNPTWVAVSFCLFCICFLEVGDVFINTSYLQRS